jgi:serine/threonine protein phosphatase PrpC
MIRWAGKSHVGLKRRINEDRILMAPELGLYAIADGVGGQRAGEVASRLAVGAIEDYWRKFKEGERPALLRPVEEPLSETAKHLINAIAFANRVINEAQKKPAYYGMGSTVAAVVEESETLWVANVGDSRVYLFHQGALVRVSEEHSLEEEQKRLGLSQAFPPGAAFAKNVLTRALGMSETVEVFIKPLETEEGDLTMLCSDGLTNYAEETSISAVLDDFSVSLERKVDILIQEANRGGGGDNVSVILLEVLKEGTWGKLKRKFLPGR